MSADVREAEAYQEAAELRAQVAKFLNYPVGTDPHFLAFDYDHGHGAMVQMPGWLLRRLLAAARP